MERLHPAADAQEKVAGIELGLRLGDALSIDETTVFGTLLLRVLSASVVSLLRL